MTVPGLDKYLMEPYEGAWFDCPRCCARSDESTDGTHCVECCDALEIESKEAEGFTFHLLAMVGRQWEPVANGTYQTWAAAEKHGDSLTGEWSIKSVEPE